MYIHTNVHKYIYPHIHIYIITYTGYTFSFVYIYIYYICTHSQCMMYQYKCIAYRNVVNMIGKNTHESKTCDRHKLDSPAKKT